MTEQVKTRENSKGKKALSAKSIDLIKKMLHGLDVEEEKKKEIYEATVEKLKEYINSRYKITQGIRKDKRAEVVRGAYLLACKQNHVYRPGIELVKSYRKVSREIGGERHSLHDAAEACFPYFPEIDRSRVMSVVKKLEKHKILYQGKSLRCVLGGIIYYVAKEQGLVKGERGEDSDYHQCDIATPLSTTSVSVRNSYLELKEWLDFINSEK